MRRVIRALPVQERSVAMATVLLLAALKIVSAAPDIKLAQGDLSAFMDTPCYLYHQFFEEDIGGWNIITTQKGTVLAHDGQEFRRSTDGGDTWSEIMSIGPDAAGCNAVVDETTGAVMLVNPTGYRLISHDDGLTWKREEITVLPNLIGHGSSQKKDLSAGAMQPGVTMTFGEHKGRLLMPVRWSPSNELQWRPYIYNTAIYSDDHGKTWQTTAPFPVLGTGEAALAEISDGRILYSSREHMSRGNRFFAWSYDGGERWLNFWRSEILPDGARGTSYGCFGGLIRLPVKDRDILLYSNLDTDRGIMPPIDQAGASRGQQRENLTVWASLDGGETWPVKRLVFAGDSGYSTLGVGRPGTPSQGRIYILFDGCTDGVWGVKAAVFNLAWLLDGEKTGNGEVPEWIDNSR
jgi:sialidase-1